MGGSAGLVVPDELENGGGVRRLPQGLTNLGMLKELRNASHGVKVLLELALRDEEENYEIDRLAVEGIEGNAAA